MANSTKTYNVINTPTIPEPLASKDKYSICKKCKVQFEQEWDGKAGKYSSFSLCPCCREKEQNSENANKTKIYKIDYQPYEYQLKMHDCDARFRLIAGAIRTGKDYSMTFECVKYAFACANEDRPDTMIPKVRAWIVAPYENIANEDFVQLRRIIPRELVADYNKSTKSLLTKNGILFEIKSAYDPESLVGVGLDIVLITEAARIKDLEDVWSNLEGRLNSQGRGLNGKGGIALINSSPLGANYFYTMYLWGADGNSDKDPQWQSFQWQHWDNPSNAEKGNEIQKNGKTYRENLENRMSDARYRQDYLAEFILNGSAVFPDFEQKCLVSFSSIKPNMTTAEKQAIIDEWQRPKLNYQYIVSWDPAITNDGSIVWVRELATNRIVYMADLNGMDIELQCDELVRLSKLYNYAPIKYGRTGIGMTLETLLVNRSANAVGFDEQGNNKARYVENLAVAIRSGKVQILDDGTKMVEQAKLQFKGYVRSVVKGKTSYANASNDIHDDHVSAAYFSFAEENVDKKKYGFFGIIKSIQ